MTKQTKSYQQLKNELDQVMRELQHEDTDIDQAVKLHADAQKLLSELESYLGKVAKDNKLDISKP